MTDIPRSARNDHRYAVGTWLQLDPASAEAKRLHCEYRRLEQRYPELEAQRINILAAHEPQVGNVATMTAADAAER